VTATVAPVGVTDRPAATTAVPGVTVTVVASGVTCVSVVTVAVPVVTVTVAPVGVTGVVVVTVAVPGVTVTVVATGVTGVEVVTVTVPGVAVTEAPAGAIGVSVVTVAVPGVTVTDAPVGVIARADSGQIATVAAPQRELRLLVTCPGFLDEPFSARYADIDLVTDVEYENPLNPDGPDVGSRSSDIPATANHKKSSVDPGDRLGELGY